VKNVSYHTVQNFPEVGFGYLELPMAEATKLKKKLNGSILKGHKLRIEDAQLEKRKRSPDEEDDDEEDAEKAKKKTRRSKKSKPGDKVLQGYELEAGRKVKRGWTETPTEKRQEKEVRKKKKVQDKEEKDAKKEEKTAKKEEKKKKAKREVSKYTTEPECLFRTTLPRADASSDKATEEEMKKARKDRKKRERQMVVHEFSNTKKHASFLKSASLSNGGHATREYVDGKGWVDADGNVLEAETVAQKEKRERKERRRAEMAAKTEAEAAAQAEAEARRLKSSKKGDVFEADKKARSKKPAAGKSTNEVAHSSSEGEASSPEPSSPEPSSSEESSDDEESAESEVEPEAAMEIDAPKPVHPLEALYKRPLLSPLDTTPKTPKDKDFSFFGGGDDSDIEQDGHTVTHNEPQTPFTEQDMEWRVTRSAAPTPDTAAIGKRFSFSVMDDISEDDDSSEQVDDDADAGATDAINGLGISDAIASGSGRAPEQDGQKEESEFAKWFFENRSENNKKWRARRREAMKLKRKRENRRLTRRIV
jgi:hypothetical protein